MEESRFKLYENWVKDGFRVFPRDSEQSDEYLESLSCFYQNVVDIRLDGRHHLCFFAKHPRGNQQAMLEMIAFAVKERGRFELGLSSKDFHILSYDYENPAFTHRLDLLERTINMVREYYLKVVEMVKISVSLEMYQLLLVLPELLAVKVFDSFCEIFDIIELTRSK